MTQNELTQWEKEKAKEKITQNLFSTWDFNDAHIQNNCQKNEKRHQKIEEWKKEMKM